MRKFCQNCFAVIAMIADTLYSKIRDERCAKAYLGMFSLRSEELVKIVSLLNGGFISGDLGTTDRATEDTVIDAWRRHRKQTADTKFKE